MLENLKITPEAKKGVEWLKEAYSFTSYSVAIDTAIQFFRINKISPRDSISENVIKSLIETKHEIKEDISDFRKWITKDTQSLRNRFGAIERDYYVLTNRKLDSIYKILIESSIDKSNLLLAEKVLNNDENIPVLNELSTVQKNDDAVSKLKRELLESDEQVKSYSRIVDSQENTFKEYKRVFNNIKKSIINEKTAFGKTKLVIDLTQEEVEELFNSLDKF
jgi:hypothetical protein